MRSRSGVERSELDVTLQGLEGTVVQFEQAMDIVEDLWLVARAPGKWCPAQVVEHVARIMEESANAAIGAPSKFPTVSRILRPAARALVFRRILRRNAFLRMRAIDAFDPTSGPTTPAEGRHRLRGALERFDGACREQARREELVPSTLFGDVCIVDFARFQQLHVQHHLQQMPRT